MFGSWARVSDGLGIVAQTGRQEMRTLIQIVRPKMTGNVKVL